MKKLILTLLGVATLATSGFSQYLGPFFYGPRGYEGRAQPNINGGYDFYGPDGYQGHSYQSYDGYYYYSPSGRYLGRSTGGGWLLNDPYLDEGDQ